MTAQQFDHMRVQQLNIVIQIGEEHHRLGEDLGHREEELGA